MSKRIAIIGSTRYKGKIREYADTLTKLGYEARSPVFDSHPDLDEYGICATNREMIEWADEVHVFWDQRSMGTIFDLGMAFALRKLIKIIHLEPKTFANFMRQYEIRGPDFKEEHDEQE